ncbi:MAG: hypothetical protein JXJ04_04280 [Spirochaetales bacterium]|nr:hypothetical protein [Spirochaetales bacterium]
MTMKKMLLVMLMIGLTLSVFAQGQQGEYGKRHDEIEQLIESKEKVSLTGELIIANRIFPELKVGTEVYKLMVPRFYLSNLTIDEGNQVTIEGVILTVKKDVTTRRFNPGEKVLFVEKALINGEELKFERGSEKCDGSRGNWGKRGQRHPHMGCRGDRPVGPGPDEEIFE